MTDDDVKMYPIMCDGGCGRRLGFSDSRLINYVILCAHCMDHLDEVEQRMGIA